MEKVMSAASKVLRGLDQAIAHARGEAEAKERRISIPDAIDVRAVRMALGLSQAEFALMFGFKVDTIRNWEQEKRVPNAQARALLTIIENEPDAVMRALAIA